VRGEQAAEADTIEEILQQLDSIEPSPQRRFIFQVGEDYPEKVVIFMKRDREKWRKNGNIKMDAPVLR